jgi:hypothetical protein
MKSFNDREKITPSKVTRNDTYVLVYPRKHVIMRRAKGENLTKTPFDPCRRGYITVRSFQDPSRPEEKWFSAHAGQFWTAVTNNKNKIYKATEQEAEWLDNCIAAGKLVPQTVDYAIY